MMPDVSRSFHPEIVVECPKCGDIYGFLHSRPTYRYVNADIERLVWRCTTCGYEVVTPTVEWEETR